MARAADAAVQRLHGLLVDTIQPGLEAIAFGLSDTAGLARCSPWMGPLCLKASAQPKCHCMRGCSSQREAAAAAEMRCWGALCKTCMAVLLKAFQPRPGLATQHGMQCCAAAEIAPQAEGSCKAGAGCTGGAGPGMEGSAMTNDAAQGSCAQRHMLCAWLVVVVHQPGSIGPGCV